jgi:hypothetical protein
MVVDRDRLRLRLGDSTPPHYGVSEFVINRGTAGTGVFIKSWAGAYFTNETTND